MENIERLELKQFPTLLREINDPPKSLYVRGVLPGDENLRWLCVVGSRKYTNYGQNVCEKLIHDLRGAPLVIVSGLALGIDSIAHRSALDAGLTTIAVPGSGLGWDVLYPRNHTSLAREIIERGGALVSEFEEHFEATPWSFPKRNRIMAGFSHAVLVIEGAQKSGTMITARLATEYNREVLAVPGPITSTASEGTNWLIKTGATPVTSGNDILEALGIAQNEELEVNKIDKNNLSENEKRVIEILQEPIPRDELIRQLNMKTHEVNTLLSMMEIKGFIAETLGEIRLQ